MYRRISGIKHTLISMIDENPLIIYTPHYRKENKLEQSYEYADSLVNCSFGKA